MGKITEAKKIYDQLAVKYFKLKGWEPFIINLTGKAVADIIAIGVNDLGIVEVKSISEQSCDTNYDDTKNLSPILNPNIAVYLQDARRKVRKLFPNRTDKIERLYAITVTCQLYRYFFEFEAILSTYAKKIPPQTIEKIKNLKKSGYLIVPIDYSQKAVTAMNILRSNNYINSYSTKEASKLFILEVVFTVF
jgi:hypothetical protein